MFERASQGASTARRSDSANAQGGFADAEGTTAPLSRSAVQDARLELFRTWIKLALRQTDDAFWEYDLNERVYRAYEFVEPFGTKETVLEDFPESAIEGGAVHPDSIPAAKRFFANMRNGAAEGSASFLLSSRHAGRYAWASLSYRLQFDDDGNPVRAVGVREDAPVNLVAGVGGLSHEPIPESLFATLLVFVQVNMETRAVDGVVYQGTEREATTRSCTVDGLVDRAVARLYSPDDEETLRRHLDLGRLAESYRSGRRWNAGRYRFVDSQGTIRHVFVATNVRKSQQTGELVCLAYACDVEPRARWEARMERDGADDPLKRPYTRESAHRLAHAVLAEAHDGSRCAVTLYRLKGIEQLASVDPGTARRLRQDVAIALAVFLGPACVVYEQDETSVVSLLPEVGSDVETGRRVGGVLKSVRTSLEDVLGMGGTRIASATYCCPAEDLDFDAALSRAETSCRLCCDDTPDADVVELCPADDRQDAEDAGLDARTAAMDSGATELDERSTRDLAQCFSAMLQAKSPGTAINRALEAVARHYHAERAYVMTVSSRNDTVAVQFEWAPGNRSSVLSAFSGQSLARFPLIKSHADATSPILVTRPAVKSSARPIDAWRFAIVPVSRTANASMIVCIENPRTDLPNWTFVERIVPHIRQEWKRLARSSEWQDDHHPLEDLPDERAFEQASSSLDFESHSSVGVVSVDVPCIERLVAESGFTHVASTTDAIVDALCEAFGPDLPFHTSDAEFTALCFDATYDSFIKRCARVRSRLLQKRPGEFRLGCSWSESLHDVRRLTEEARASMRADGGRVPADAAAIARKGAVEDGKQGSALPVDERFAVFLQPKIDMRTGTLVGAEALARVLDEGGNPVSPVGAIDSMERDGTVRDLDFYVFDRTLSLMSSWRSKGLRLVPVSSNFSRSTLLGSTALASVLAIMSRYPEIPADLVEMEITETAGDLGKETFSRLVDSFHKTGVRIALDDFGSHYSNAAVLANAEFDVVKIDQSIVGDMPGNETSRLLVKSIVEICNARKMSCVAEGIETKAQANALLAEGCYFCQGFYYDRPLPAGAFEEKYLLGRA